MSATPNPNAPPGTIFSLANVDAFRRNRITAAMQTYAPDVVLPDAELLDQLWAAEAEIQRKLGVWLTPRRILSSASDPTTLAAAQAGPYPVVLDPGDDYDVDLLLGESWGFRALRHRPVIQFNQMWFNYPAPQSRTYTVPADWIRLDARYGTLNVVPAADTVTLPLSAFLLSIFGNGQCAPLIIQYDYVAGLQNVQADYPDLLNLIRRKAVLLVLDNLFIPQSGSLSIDGLSGSLSFDAGKYQEQIDRDIDALRDRLVGVRLMVF